MIAQVTQHLRPDGKKRQLSLEIPDEYFLQYELIHACGCWLACEQLRDYKAVHYITSKNGDFAIKVTAPDDKKAADAALLEMIKKFDRAEFEKWNEQFKLNELKGKD